MSVITTVTGQVQASPVVAGQVPAAPSIVMAEGVVLIDSFDCECAFSAPWPSFNFTHTFLLRRLSANSVAEEDSPEGSFI